jgi:hypothetical protein
MALDETCIQILTHCLGEEIDFSEEDEQSAAPTSARRIAWARVSKIECISSESMRIP